MQASRNRLLLLLVIGLMVRLGFAIGSPTTPTSDAASYDTLGRAIAEGRGFVDPDGSANSFRPPLYPLFIAALYAIGGEHPSLVRVAQALVDLATCALLFWWVRRRLGEREAFVSLLFTLFSMSAIASVRVLLSECVAAFLLTASVVLFDLAAEKDDRARLWLAVGVLTGLLTLTRGMMVLLPLFFLFALPMLKRSRYFVRGAVAMLAAYVLVLSLWLLRNQQVVGSPVLTTQGGITLYSSYFRNPGQPFGVLTNDPTVERSARMSALEGDRFLTHEVMRRLTDSPSLFLKAIPTKLLYFFAPLDWEIIGGRTFNATYFFVLLLLIPGVIVAWRKARSFLLLTFLPVIYLSLMSIVFYGSPRFRLPAEPLLTPVAAIGALALLKGTPFAEPAR